MFLWQAAVAALLESLSRYQPYAHTAWTCPGGFIKVNIYTIAHDARWLSWLGTEFVIFASMAFALCPGSHPRVNISLGHIGYSAHATELFGWHICGLASWNAASDAARGGVDRLWDR